MPSKSPFPDIEIPNVDLWGLMFERKEKDFPDDTVIYRACDNSRHYTFAHVKSLAIKFGEGLRSAWEWEKNDVLALYAPNDIDVPPVIYGTFYAGGIVTPANPAYSIDELAYQLQNSEAKAIFTTKAFLSTALKAAEKCGIPVERVALIGAEEDETMKIKHWTRIVKSSGTDRFRRRIAKPDTDLAFLAYSSGTTGLPKGVMLSHRNIVADVLMIQGAVGKWYSSKHDKFLGVLPFFHIYGLTGLVHQILYRGIELLVMPAFNLEVFLQTIQTHKITFIYVAPPVLVRLSRDPIVEKYDLSSVKMITSGAAPLTKELVDAVYKRLKVKVNQAYGLSETSPMTHTQPWDEWYTSVGSTGKMFPNMRAKYISADGKELGPGETGELWLAGPNIFKGYWKNEQATKDAISEDGYFKTGDVGYLDENHNFYITDRVKELIKYKGFQVAPAELEGKLLEHHNIDDVAVIGIEDKEMHTEIPRAYVVAGKHGKEEKHAKEIMEWFTAKVANHKRLRGGVHFVDEIPKSASGKILRRVLKEKAKSDAEKGLKAKL
ncbi:acetyl-CoA synthetase-like protein [Venturia nashicola]|uniref:Acetyl-CoA synthetase-like protein n=1 Tax=Venturia nashicola TaxID=86259 RepID=A0A4Z1NSF4_9PEZI|nr:acetyl-CoA synthetase-like protein [Venturia nashicola]TLD27484.1 acetyl-CoA synthetase-like protein [Venturia nashicola]